MRWQEGPCGVNVQMNLLWQLPSRRRQVDQERRREHRPRQHGTSADALFLGQQIQGIGQRQEPRSKEMSENPQYARRMSELSRARLLCHCKSDRDNFCCCTSLLHGRRIQTVNLYMVCSQQTFRCLLTLAHVAALEVQHDQADYDVSLSHLLPRREGWRLDLYKVCCSQHSPGLPHDNRAMSNVAVMRYNTPGGWPLRGYNAPSGHNHGSYMDARVFTSDR